MEGLQDAPLNCRLRLESELHASAYKWSSLDNSHSLSDGNFNHLTTLSVAKSKRIYDFLNETLLEVGY